MTTPTSQKMTAKECAGNVWNSFHSVSGHLGAAKIIEAFAAQECDSKDKRIAELERLVEAYRRGHDSDAMGNSRRTECDCGYCEEARTALSPPKEG